MPKSKKPFEKALEWFRRNEPGALYSRDKNADGFKLSESDELEIVRTIIGEKYFSEIFREKE